MQSLQIAAHRYGHSHAQSIGSKFVDDHDLVTWLLMQERSIGSGSRALIIETRASVDVFSKKHFWVNQGPINKIKKATRLPPKGPADLWNLSTLQLNNFCTQSSKHVNEGLNCSSIINLHMNSIISKIRRWRIEILSCEEFDMMRNEVVHENSMHNSLQHDKWLEFFIFITFAIILNIHTLFNWVKMSKTNEFEKENLIQHVFCNQIIYFICKKFFNIKTFNFYFNTFFFCVDFYLNTAIRLYCIKSL